MSAPTISPLPDPPDRALDQTGFVAACKAWFAALQTFATQINAALAWYLRLPCTVAQLPVLTSGDVGSRGFVTDANSATFNASAAGGGSNKVPVFWDGAGWKIG